MSPISWAKLCGTSTQSSSAQDEGRANHIDEAKGAKLKLIIRGGVGVDNIDVKYAEENGIKVREHPACFLPVCCGAGTGPYVLLRRSLSIAGHTMREDKWEKKAYGKGIELQGKTLGIVGFSRIGQHLGAMAKAIGMDVIAFDIFHIPGIEEQMGISYVEMDELLAKSDFISVHAPAVDGGALISAANIEKMKDGVCIINTSRGTNVDEDAAGRSGIRQGPRCRPGRLLRKSPRRTMRSTAIPWSPAHRTSALPPWKPRSGSVRRLSPSSKNFGK